MKINRYFLLSCLMIFISILTLHAQNATDNKKEKAAVVKKRIDAGNYKIEVLRAYPQRGNSVSLTSPYSLEIRNDSVISQLPFFGRAYSIPYGGGDGLMFKAPVEEYKVNYKSKKQQYQIRLKAKTPEDTYQYTIDIYSNGSSNISVTMRNRAPISYSGEMDLLPL